MNRKICAKYCRYTTPQLRSQKNGWTNSSPKHSLNWPKNGSLGQSSSEAPRHPLLAAMAMAALTSILSSSTSVVVEAFAVPPQLRAPSSSISSSRFIVSIRLGPERDGSSAAKNKSDVSSDNDDDSGSSKKFRESFDPHDPNIHVVARRFWQ